MVILYIIFIVILLAVVPGYCQLIKYVSDETYFREKILDLSTSMLQWILGKVSSKYNLVFWWDGYLGGNYDKIKF